MDIENIPLDVKQLTSLGIIINELLTNISKYAFTNKKSGLIDIHLKENDGFILLMLKDNGVGISFDSNFKEGFGLMVVKMLTKQLNGVISINVDDGTVVKIKFKPLHKT